MKRSRFLWFLVLGSLLASCLSTSSDGAGSPSGADSDGDSKREAEELASKLKVAELKLEGARIELDSFQASHEVRVKHARAELQLAEAELAQFREVDRPARLAETELDLRSARDRAQEAAEELEQIEIMYEGQDLDDRTAEFVVSRGRRNAERAAQRIQIQEMLARGQADRELPREQSRLELAVSRAAAALADLELEGRVDAYQKRASVLEAEAEVARIRHDLKEAAEEAKP